MYKDNEMNSQSKEKKRTDDKKPAEPAGILDALHALPDNDKRKHHRKKMLEIYREAFNRQETDAVELEDGELELTAAAGVSRRELMLRCPYCGREFPSDRLEEHKRSVHGN